MKPVRKGMQGSAQMRGGGWSYPAIIQQNASNQEASDAAAAKEDGNQQEQQEEDGHPKAARGSCRLDGECLGVPTIEWIAHRCTRTSQQLKRASSRRSGRKEFVLIY